MLIPSEHDDEEIMPALIEAVSAQLSHKEITKLAISRVRKSIRFIRTAKVTQLVNMFCSDLIFVLAKHSILTSMNVIHPFTPPSLSHSLSLSHSIYIYIYISRSVK